MNVARCSAYAPAAFTPQEIFLVVIAVREWVEPRANSRVLQMTKHVKEVLLYLVMAVQTETSNVKY
jgi:hypothetical protein